MIEGWNQGVLGMKIGGVRELTIPAELAYGETGSGKIPANSPIKFVLMTIPPLTAEEVAERPQL
jgi:FKBP-type peptidyl-prolyl cis-trans isomerase